MKTKLLIALFFCMFSFAAWAQQDNEGKIKAWRVAYITDKLELTPDESATFWPVYNERQRKVEDLKKSINSDKREMATMNDNELEAVILKQLQTQKDIVDLNIEYYHKLKKVIPIRKIARLQLAERQFQRSLLEKMQEMKKDRMQNRQNFKGNGPRG